jgi:hemerythrin-like domain-containing protein
MQLLAELRQEHRLVDRLAGSLVRFAGEAVRGTTAAADVADFVHVLRVFVVGYHHEREEMTLFATLVERAEVPGDRGPIAVLVEEHRAGADLVDELERAAPEAVRAADVATRLAHHLWEHVDKEESVLFPEAEQRLVRSAVNRLEGRRETAGEAAARELGVRLAKRFPPLDDPDIVRGDGCIACSAFAVTCGGIEKEWWSTWDREYHRTLDEG